MLFIFFVFFRLVMIMTQMTNSESHPQSFRPLSTGQHRQPSSSQALHERPSRPFRIGCQLPTIDRFLATDRDNEPNTTFPPSDVILNPFLTADDGTGDCRSNKAVTHGSISFGSASRTISFVLGSRSSAVKSVSSTRPTQTIRTKGVASSASSESPKPITQTDSGVNLDGQLMAPLSSGVPCPPKLKRLVETGT